MSRKNPYLGEGVAKKSTAGAFIVFGCLLMCCLGGLMFANGGVRPMAFAALLPGLVFVGVGIARARDAKKKPDDGSSES